MSTESLQNLLYSQEPFFSRTDYLSTTAREFAIQGTLPPSFEWSTESKVRRIVKQILYIVLFPVATYQLIHRLIGKVFIHASSPFILKNFYKQKTSPASVKKSLNLLEAWKYKRITIMVNGTAIDCVVMGKPGTLQNRRWVLVSCGNGEYFESFLTKKQKLRDVLVKIQGNAIFFNYPGVGASSGLPNKTGMIQAYTAVLSLLENKEVGAGAQEIIGYGHSFIGAGVQAEAIDSLRLKRDIKYLFIKDRAASSVSDAGSAITHKPLGSIVKWFNWDFETATHSKRLRAPEIILQTANVALYEQLQNSSKIVDDDILPKKATLAKVLLDDHCCLKTTKTFIGIYEGHSSPLNHPAVLGEYINTILDQGSEQPEKVLTQKNAQNDLKTFSKNHRFSLRRLFTRSTSK